MSRTTATKTARMTQLSLASHPRWKKTLRMSQTMISLLSMSKVVRCLRKRGMRKLSAIWGKNTIDSTRRSTHTNAENRWLRRDSGSRGDSWRDRKRLRSWAWHRTSWWKTSRYRTCWPSTARSLSESTPWLRKSTTRVAAVTKWSKCTTSRRCSMTTTTTCRRWEAQTSSQLGVAVWILKNKSVTMWQTQWSNRPSRLWATTSFNNKMNCHPFLSRPQITATQVGLGPGPMRTKTFRATQTPSPSNSHPPKSTIS